MDLKNNKTNSLPQGLDEISKVNIEVNYGDFCVCCTFDLNLKLLYNQNSTQKTRVLYVNSIDRSSVLCRCQTWDSPPSPFYKCCAHFNEVNGRIKSLKKSPTHVDNKGKYIVILRRWIYRPITKSICCERISSLMY